MIVSIAPFRQKWIVRAVARFAVESERVSLQVIDRRRQRGIPDQGDPLGNRDPGLVERLLARQVSGQNVEAFPERVSVRMNRIQLPETDSVLSTFEIQPDRKTTKDREVPFFEIHPFRAEGQGEEALCVRIQVGVEDELGLSDVDSRAAVIGIRSVVGQRHERLTDHRYVRIDDPGLGFSDGEDEEDLHRNDEKQTAHEETSVRAHARCEPYQSACSPGGHNAAGGLFVRAGWLG